MFKHITPYPWTVGRRGMQTSLSVWGYENDFGIPLVAECHSKDAPLTTQRANARLIAIAPQMFEILRSLTNNEEAQMLVRYMERDNENQTTE